MKKGIDLTIQTQLEYLILEKLGSVSSPMTAHDMAAALAENGRLWQQVGEAGQPKLFDTRISGVLSDLASDNVISCVSVENKSKAYRLGPRSLVEAALDNRGPKILEALDVDVLNLGDRFSDDWVPEIYSWNKQPRLMLTEPQIKNLVRALYVVCYG